MILKGFKRHFVSIIILLLLVNQLVAQQKELAPKPPMGWNSWNFFEHEISDSILREIADAMVSSGLKDAGYEYIIIDDFWVGGRDNKNRLFPDPQRFPNGIKAVSDYVHAKGLKIGIYSDAAEYTCGGVTGSLGFEVLDAQTFADWEIDYLKYDYCNAPTDLETAFLRYKKMGDALQNSGRDIVFAICEWGQRQPWLWAKAAGGHLWRTTYDSRDCWESGQTEDWIRGGILEIFDLQEDITKYNGPNSWNDPDMLMVGLFGKGKSSSWDHRFKGCTQTEYNTHFALWCMLSAPLMINSDIRNLDSVTLSLLTNQHLIMIDQDPLGKSAETLSNDGNLQVLRKELATNEFAICVFNRSEKKQNFSYRLREDFNIWYPTEIFQVWNEKKFSGKSISGTIEPHGCEVYLVKKK